MYGSCCFIACCIYLPEGIQELLLWAGVALLSRLSCSAALPAVAPFGHQPARATRQ